MNRSVQIKADDYAKLEAMVDDLGRASARMARKARRAVREEVARDLEGKSIAELCRYYKSAVRRAMARPNSSLDSACWDARADAALRVILNTPSRDLDDALAKVALWRWEGEAGEDAEWLIPDLVQFAKKAAAA